MRVILAIVGFFACGSQAFVFPSHNAFVSSPLNLMTTADIDALVKHATDCSEGECSIDEVEDLVDNLKNQQKELHDQIDKIRVMIKSLELMNKSDGSRDDVKETVRAIMRIFTISDKASGNDFPYSGGVATGYSGEVGKGPTTAYDALKPKKYTP